MGLGGWLDKWINQFCRVGGWMDFVWMDEWMPDGSWWVDRLVNEPVL